MILADLLILDESRDFVLDLDFEMDFDTDEVLLFFDLKTTGGVSAWLGTIMVGLGVVVPSSLINGAF
jgi:hypothetical protein